MKNSYKFLIYKIIFGLMGLLVVTSVSAKTINEADIPKCSYVIGTHLFTRNINESYNGILTTKLIMLAAQTIDSDEIDDMIIYYKTSSGKWIDGLTGKLINDVEQFDIEYEDTKIFLETPVLILNNGYLTIEQADFNTIKEGWMDEIKGQNYKTVSTTTYYRYRDLVYKWKTTTKEYYSESAFYTSAPTSEYSEAESVGLGWKWYKENTVNVDSQNQIKAHKFQEFCSNGGKFNIGHCESIGQTVYAYTYTCDDQTTTNPKTVCAASCETGVLSEDKTTCTYKTKSYYPSNASSASGEKTYYQSAPTSGAIKDESTGTNVSKWYKTITNITDKYYATAPTSGATKATDGVWGNWSSYQTTQPETYSNTRQIESRIKVKYQTIKKIDGWELYEKENNIYNLIESYDLSNSSGLFKIEENELRTFSARSYKLSSKGDKIYSNYSDEYLISTTLNSNI